MRKTKIVCTIGPASGGEDIIGALIKAGMDMGLNFSHGAYVVSGHLLWAAGSTNMLRVVKI
jgi:pyruvate kinase